MRVSFVVCGNGYGHLKRTLQVGSKIMEQDKEHVIQVIGASYQQPLFTNWMVESGMNEGSWVFVNGQTETNLRLGLPDDYSFPDYCTSLKYIQENIEAFDPDRVVSDNLVGVLSHNKSALLMGSFLWSDVLPYEGRMSEVIDFEEDLLRKHAPEMIGVADIVMPGAREKTHFIGMPWFCEPEPIRKLSTEGNGDCKRVLVTGGGTNTLTDALHTLASTLSRENRLKIFVDSKLFTTSPGEFEEFSFTENDFRKLDWIICRPGAGILTEAVRYRVPLCTLADDNLEIVHNAACMERLGIGFSHRSVKETTDILLDRDTEKYCQAFEKLETGGAALAASHILKPS